MSLPGPVETTAPTVGVVTAGISDLPAATEAVTRLEAQGVEVELITDVGVAGLHRLLDVLDELRTFDAIICCAGMEGALPSVLAGLVAVPIIAVPTSVGYGVGGGGIVALCSALTSCAPGLAVVDIDDGASAADAMVRVLLR